MVLLTKKCGYNRYRFSVIDEVSGVDHDVFKDNLFITRVCFGEEVTFLGVQAFSNCSNLQSVEFNNIKRIGDKAFSNTGLMEVRIPKGCIVGEEAFSLCKNMESALILNNSISKGQFMGCSKLKQIVLPDDLASIGTGAFRGCASLEEVWYQGTKYTDYNNLLAALVSSRVEVHWGAFVGTGLSEDHCISTFKLWCRELGYVSIAEGNGSNLTSEDEEEGYKDYIMLDVAKGIDDEDGYEGAQVMLSELYQEQFSSSDDVIEHLIDDGWLESYDYCYISVLDNFL